MRILVSFVGGSGHYLPTVPFARVLQAKGHDVTFTCQESMIPTVIADGWAATPSGGATLLDPALRRPLAPLDRAAEEQAIRRFFAGRVARERTGRLLRLARQWEPALILHDEVDFGAAVAAEVLQLPHAAVIVLAAGGLLRPDVVGEPLAALRAEHGLDEGGALDMLHRNLTLVPGPPSFRDPLDPLPATAHHVRPAVLEQARLEVVAARAPRPAVAGRPLVYVTVGTIFNQECGDLLDRVVAGVAELDADIVVTVGPQIDPAELGPQPANVRVEQFLDLSGVLSAADIVVSHGGSGTVLAALAFGLPQLLLPMGADQPLNADRCLALGFGVVLDAQICTPEAVRQAASTLLENPSYRTRARQIQDEIAALPDAEHAASLLEHLAT